MLLTDFFGTYYLLKIRIRSPKIIRQHQIRHSRRGPSTEQEGGWLQKMILSSDISSWLMLSAVKKYLSGIILIKSLRVILGKFMNTVRVRILREKYDICYYDTVGVWYKDTLTGKWCIMQNKFYFHPDIVTYFLSAVLQLDIAAWCLISRHSDNSNQICLSPMFSPELHSVWTHRVSAAVIITDLEELWLCFKKKKST